MTRRTLLAAAVAVASGCVSQKEIQSVDWPQVGRAVGSGPGLIYFWALWSRPSVELLSSVAELASEHEALPFVAVCLDDDPDAALPRAASITRTLTASLEHLLVRLDFERLEADFQLTEPPAAVVFAATGEPLARLEGDSLTPERLDAFAAEAAAMMTTPPLGR